MNTINILSIIIILLLLINIGITIYMIYNKKKQEKFCNCFAAQYDGSEGDPNHRSYYGGYCYEKDKITKLYNEGKFENTFSGV